MQVVRSVRKSCKAYLASVMDVSGTTLALIDVKIVRDFVDIFPKDLFSLQSKCEVEFSINLLLGTTPISKTPYHMALTYLKELKTLL